MSNLSRTETSARGGRASQAPALGGILETTLYASDLDAARSFYERILRLPMIFSVAGRQLVFRCGESILLVFNAEHTRTNQVIINNGAIPLHGTEGAGHAAFRVATTELEAWRRRLSQTGIPIESEVSWPNGAHSIYFRDPAGNSLELATPDLWLGLNE